MYTHTYIHTNTDRERKKEKEREQQEREEWFYKQSLNTESDAEITCQKESLE